MNQKVTASPVALFFNIGKATLDKKELTNLEFYVGNAIKADKEQDFYADWLGGQRYGQQEDFGSSEQVNNVWNMCTTY